MIKINKLKIMFVFGMLLGLVHSIDAQMVGTPYLVPLDPTIPFSFLAGGADRDMALAMEPTADGGYITISASLSSATGDVTGTSNSESASTPSIWIVKYSNYGKIEWQRLYGGSSAETALIPSSIIKQTSDGGYIFVVGSSSSISGDVTQTNHGRTDLWVVKITATGAITWQRLYGGSENDLPGGIIQTSDGGYLIGGYTSSSASGDVTSVRNSTSDSDFWVLKVTSTGAITWQRTYTNPGPALSSNNMPDLMVDLVAAPDGSGYVMAGHSNSAYRSTSSPTDFSITKIDFSGNILWQKLYGSDKNDFMASFSPTSDGGYILTGRTSGSANGDITEIGRGGNDIWVVKLNSAGNLQWQKLLGGSGSDSGHYVIQTSDGGYMVAGSSTSTGSGDVTDLNKGGYDVCVFKLSATGATQWMKLYGGNSSDGDNSLSVGYGGSSSPARIKETSDGNYIIFASSSSTNSGDVTDTTNSVVPPSYLQAQFHDQWLFKINPTGNIIEVLDVGQKD